MVESIVISNIATFETLTMDKLNTEDYILDYVDWGQASVTQYTSKYINQIGATINKVSFDTRNIEISGFIVADTEQQMTERKEFLNSFVNPQNEYYAIYDDYRILFQPTNSVRYANTEEANNNEIICKFRIDGVCPNPLFITLDNVNISLERIVSKFHFPFSIPEDSGVIFGIVNESPMRKTVIDNVGDVAIGIKFKFIAKGEVQNPTLYNFTTGQSFTINKTLVDKEEVVVETSIGSKSVYGKIGLANLTNYFAYKTLDSNWVFLQKGKNELGCSAVQGGKYLDVIIQYEPMFLEVQKCY